MNIRFVSALCLFGLANGVLAQDYTQGTAGIPLSGNATTLVGDFYRQERIEDAPVSARFLTRTVRDLYDGNRIVQELSVMMFRDSRGRVRRETQSSPAGYRSLTGYSLPVTIADPVEGQTIVLDPSSKTAYRISARGDVVRNDRSMAPIEHGPLRSGTAGQRVTSESAPTMVVQGAIALPGVAMPGEPSVETTSVEQLGKSTMQGVSVTGTRYSTTYPANAFGNERSIVTVKETWYSPELKMMIRSELHDPRVGTVLYEVDLLSTGEPDPTLFAVPADYTMVEAPAGNLSILFK